MSFQIGQIVFCGLFGDGFYKIVASPEHPLERYLPIKETVIPAKGFDYVIMPFSEIMEDGNTWFLGQMDAKESWLKDATKEFADFYKSEMDKRENSH